MDQTQQIMVPTQAQVQTTSAPHSVGGEEVKLFVGQVPDANCEEELRNLFGTYGTVSDVFFMKDRVAGTHKGCAFITMISKEAADAAIAGLNDKHTLENAKRPLIVNFATRKDSMNEGEVKVYVSLLSKATTEEELKIMFSPYGDVLDVFLMKNLQDGTSKGAGFIKYRSLDQAQTAISALNGIAKDKDSPHFMQVRLAINKQNQQQQQQMAMYGNQMAMYGYGGMGAMGMGAMGYGAGASGGMSGYGAGASAGQVQAGAYAAAGQTYPDMYGIAGMTSATGMGMGMGLATPYQKPESMKGPNGCNLFVYGIPDSYSDADLTSLFANFGQIVSANVQIDLQTGKSKGFGFVSYTQPANAQAAIQAMDGFMISGKKLSVRLKGPPKRASPY